MESVGELDNSRAVALTIIESVEDTSQKLKFNPDDTVVTSPAETIMKKASSELVVSVTVISGPRTGLTFIVKPDTSLTLGRSPDADIQIIDTGISRKHIHMRFDTDRVFVEDLESANGTYINGEQLSGEIEVRNGDQISIGVSTVLKFSLSNQLDADYQNHIQHQLSRDSLTNAYNRKAFTQCLNSLYITAKQDFTPICLIMIDVDNFKMINDTYGHQIGDKILKYVARTLFKSVRSVDYVCRYGGDEFSIVCPSIDSLRGLQLAEKIRTNVEALRFKLNDKRVNVTASIGISNYPENQIQCVSQFIAYADKALYKAKRNGRNQIGVISSM